MTNMSELYDYDPDEDESCPDCAGVGFHKPDCPQLEEDCRAAGIAPKGDK
jgi:hypothetical protein